jgi:hypothetical protein
MMKMPRLSFVKSTLISLLVLLIVTVMGSTRLLETFWGDQALFVVYAEEINRGALLYRDVWDLKQPGIFLFYLTGGKLFGFTEFGIHLFELLYWLMFSIILSISLEDYFRSPFFAKLTPLMTVGFYYAICGSLHLTQVEGLVGFPLYLSLWATVRAVESQSASTTGFLLFASGLAGGIVLVFKLILLPIVALFWLSLLIFLVMRRGIFLPKVLLLTVAPILFGLVIPLLAVIAYFAWYDALDVMNYTFFGYPSRALNSLAGRNRLPILKQGLYWFITSFLPLIIFTFIWALLAVKRWKTQDKSLSNRLMNKNRQIDLVTVNLILWLFAGFVVILAQGFSWWEYHYLLLLVPFGVLATKGIDRLWEAVQVNAFFTRPAGRLIFIICIFLLFVPTLKLAAWRAKNTFISRMNSPTEPLLTPSGDMDALYEKTRTETAFLFDENSRPGKIFVCGQPLYYYLSKRPPAFASNGWMPELFLPEQWKQLGEELATKSPPYVSVEKYCRGLMEVESPETLQILENNYRLRSEREDVLWYELISKP